MSPRPNPSPGADDPGEHAAGRRAALDLSSAVVLAIAAALIVMAPAGAAVGVTLVAVITVVAFLQAWRRAQADPQRHSMLGAATALRSAAVLVLLCSWRFRDGTDLWWTGLAALILVGLIAVEDLLLRLLRLPVPFVHAMPGVRSLPGPSRLVPAISWASLAALILGAALWLVGMPGWTWTLAALLSLGPTAWVIVHTRARRRAEAALLRRIPAALADYAPEFVLYTARPDDASYQVMMWLPYLQRTGRRFVIVTRAALPAERLAALTDVPVLQRRTATDLEAALVPSVRAAFYVNASSGNGALTRFGRLEHVYLGHGDSDKPPSYNPTHAMFDLIFAAGPAAVRRYAEHGVAIAAEKFRVVGRPQVETVHPPRRALTGCADPVVLYAPTWRGHVSETALSSLDAGPGIVEALLQHGTTVIFRPHPFSYDFAEDAATIARIQSRLAQDARQTGRAHRWGPAAETDCSVIEAMNAADALVSDVSSVVSDFLFSGKPYAMIATVDDLLRFARDYPVARAAYLVDPALNRLHEALGLLLGDDPLAARRGELRADYLGERGASPADPEGGPDAHPGASHGAADYAQTFVDAVTEVLDTPVGPPEPAAETDDGTARLSRDTIQRHARTLGRTLLGLLLSTLALTAALVVATGHASGSTGPVVLCCVAALLTLVLLIGTLSAQWRAIPGSVRRSGTGAPGPVAIDRPSDRLTVLDAARVALALTLAVGVAGLAGVGATPGAPVVSVVLVVLLVVFVASILTEAAVLELLTGPGVVAAHLLELRVREVPAARQLFAPLAGAVALTVDGLLLGWAFSGPNAPVPVVLLTLLIVVALLAAVPAMTLLRSSLQRALGSIRAEHRVGEVLTARRTAFCVYFGSGIGASYQLGMWLPYFERIGLPYLIVCRDRSSFAEIRTLIAGREIPLLLRETLGSLESIVVPGLTAAFYVNNAVRNTHLIERRELTHVWLNHGDSEKPACFNPVHAIYDLIFAAGQAGIDRYGRHGVEIPADKFRIVGRPQVEGIESLSRVDSEAALENEIDTLVGAGASPTVLYAPTWRGPYADSQLYSLPVGAAIVAGLLRRGVRVVFRAHPFNYRFPDAVAMITAVQRLLAEDRQRTGRPHLWGDAAERERSVTDCFNESDAMISDVSAMVSDYLQSTKPFAIVAVGQTPEQLYADVPAARGGYLLDADPGEPGPTFERRLDDLFDRLLAEVAGEPGLRNRRVALRSYYLGDFAGGAYADGFLEHAREVIGTGSVVEH